MLKFLAKLAWSNLKTNRYLYIPYGLVMSITIALSYIFNSLAENPMFLTARGGSPMQTVLGLGTYIVMIVAISILIYANNYVIKNRMREFGLYSVLGVGKRHLQRLTGLELCYFACVTIASGIGLGVIFERLAFAGLQYLMKLPVTLTATFSMKAFVTTIVIFIMAYALLLGLNWIRMMRLQPLAILKEVRVGAKKGRFLWLKAIVGMALLAGGYYLANTTEDPMSAIVIFFVAVLLVIGGTFLLFDAGITTFLKLLQHHKGYYYHPTRMISISNLVFRMRQNAAGLATICILSTMTLVTFVGALALYFGSTRMVNLQYPSDLVAKWQVEVDQRALVRQDFEKELARYTEEKGITIANQSNYQFLGFFGKWQGNAFEVSEEFTNDFQAAYLKVIDQTLYQTYTGTFLDLKENEVAVMTEKIAETPTIKVNQREYQVKYQQAKPEFLEGKMPADFTYIMGTLSVLVVPDLETFISQVGVMGATYEMGANLTLQMPEEEQLKQFAEVEPIKEMFTVSNRSANAAALYEMIGVALFVGYFLAFLFMMGMILTMYYKQMSEGNEDQLRFKTLYQIGLDNHLVKKTVNQQVLLVFLLPIIVAVIHMAFAFKVLSSILMMIAGLVPAITFNITIVVTIVFVLFYVIIYLLTARQYTKLISPIRDGM